MVKHLPLNTKSEPITQKEFVELYKQAIVEYGDDLPHPEQQPIQFVQKIKNLRFYNRLKKNEENQKNNS